MLSGKHLIGGDWAAGSATCHSSPAYGPCHEFAVGSSDDVQRAAEAAEAAFASYSGTRRGERAAFLDRVANEIELRAGEITAVGCQETAPPDPGPSMARWHGCLNTAIKARNRHEASPCI